MNDLNHYVEVEVRPAEMTRAGAGPWSRSPTAALALR
jgi:hypothetical protein